MALAPQNIHCQAGDVRGIVLDVLAVSVDATASGVTVLGILNGAQAAYRAKFGQWNTSFDFRVFFVSLHVTAASGVLVVPTLSLGSNGTSYNDIMIGTALTGLSGAGKHSVFVPLGSTTAPYGSTVACNVTTPATATALTLEVSLIGCFCTST